MEAKKTPKRTKPIQSKKDDSITIEKNIPSFNYEDEEEISFEEGLQRIMETTTKLRESVVGDIMKDYHTKIVEPLIDGLLNGMTDFTKNLGILSLSMIQAMTQQLVEEANKLHEQWIQKLATLESEYISLDKLNTLVLGLKLSVKVPPTFFTDIFLSIP